MACDRGSNPRGGVIKMNLIEISKKRQKTAHEIIKKLDLIRILSEVGKAYLVGSIALGTVWKRDIDFHIHLKKYTAREAVNYVKEKLSKKKILNLKVRSYPHLKGWVMGFEYKEKRIWEIDLFFSRVKPDSAFHYKWIKPLLTKEKLKIILKLKNYYLKRKLLRMGMSYQIYEAVLKNKVKTTKEFEDFLKTKNLDLEYFRKKQGKKEKV